MSCSNTNQCSNSQCKNTGDDNLHACCVDNQCVCTADACPISDDGILPAMYNNRNLIVFISFASLIAVLVPIIVMFLNRPQRIRID